MNNINLVENSQYKLDSSLSKKQKEEIIELGEKIKGKFSLRNNPIVIKNGFIKVNSICGSFVVGDIQINIIPKFINVSQEKIDKEIFQFAIKEFLSFCGKLENNIVYISDNGLLKNLWCNNVIEYMANDFIKCVTKSLEKYPISWYNKKKSQLNYIKGNIIIEKEINKIGLFDGKTWCKYTAFENNNKFNALLKWTCNFFISRINNYNIIRKLENIKLHFANVNTNILNQSIVKNMILPKQYNFYKECFEIAKNLYLNINIGYMKGSTELYGLIINMEKCFEKFVSGAVKKASTQLGYKHYSQKQRILAESTNNKRNFYTRPDDIIETEDKIIIMDAKYKLLSEKSNHKNKPINSDFYQMIASCIAYNSNVAVLFYPRAKEEPVEEEKWKVINPINGDYIMIFMLPINIIANNIDLKYQIINKFKEVIKLADNI